MKSLLLALPALCLLTSPFAAQTRAADVALTGSNTKLEFVCAHTGDKPDPRKGSFAKLTGTAVVDAGALSSIAVEIETASITTEIDKLTTHLKSPDFFNVRQHPKASFKSTKIVRDKTGAVTVTGNLTLLNETKEISFPATVSADGGLKLKARFTLDRSQFGMTYGLDKVEKNVSLTIAVDASGK